MTKWYSNKTLNKAETDGETVIPFNSLPILDYYKKNVSGWSYPVFYLLTPARASFLKKEGAGLQLRALSRQ